MNKVLSWAFAATLICSAMVFTFGPNVSDAHTLNEHVEISSIERAWLYLLEVLKHIK